MDGCFNDVSQEKDIQKEKKVQTKGKNEIRLKSFLSKDTK